jgi:hypothetical protein
MDGYMARHILSDPNIAKETFADYAFTASAIFAAQQVALRSGHTTRCLDTEYPYFIFRSLDPCLRRIVSALDCTPLSINLWSENPPVGEEKEFLAKLLVTLEGRTVRTMGLEQIFQLFECSENTEGVRETRARLFQVESPPPQGKIGILVMGKFGHAKDYILAFDRLKSRLSELAVVLIYDKRSVVDLCWPALASIHPWRGMALKHLAYQKDLYQDDYVLAALQANFVYS